MGERFPFAANNCLIASIYSCARETTKSQKLVVFDWLNHPRMGWKSSIPSQIVSEVLVFVFSFSCWITVEAHYSKRKGEGSGWIWCMAVFNMIGHISHEMLVKSLLLWKFIVFNKSCCVILCAEIND